ncbi:MAG: GHKL domain-containing protein [Acidobacteria bacterium]|nr:GHKL domain-containing protein [Acidobacteriota bacterium]
MKIIIGLSVLADVILLVVSPPELIRTGFFYQAAFVLGIFLWGLLFTPVGRRHCLWIFDAFVLLAIVTLTLFLIQMKAGPQNPFYHYYYLLLFFVMIIRLPLGRVIIHAVLLSLSSGLVMIWQFFADQPYSALFEYRLVFLLGLSALIVMKVVDRRHARERKSLEAQNLRMAHHRSVVMEAIVRINELFMEEADFQETLNKVGLIAKSVTGAHHLWMYLIPEGDTTGCEVLHLDPEPEFCRLAQEVGFTSGKFSTQPADCRRRYQAFEGGHAYIARGMANYSEGQFSPEHAAALQSALEADIFVSLPFVTQMGKRRVYAAITFVFSEENYDLFLLNLFVNTFGTSILLHKARAQRHEAFAQLEKAHRELKETQGRILALERSAQIASLAAGITHDINNPLGALQASVDLVAKSNNRLKKNGCASPDDIRKIIQIIDSSLSIITSAIERINSVVRALKNFSRLDRARVAFADLNTSIENVVLLLQPKILRRVRIESQLSPLPRLKCNPQEINQLTMNLIVNAIEASPKGGTVTISTNLYEKEVCLQVSDQGEGIAAEIGEQIYEPMFTTKPDHAGMGLTLVKDIVVRHNGRIRCESSGSGTSFHVCLPVEGPINVAAEILDTYAAEEPTAADHHPI